MPITAPFFPTNIHFKSPRPSPPDSAAFHACGSAAINEWLRRGLEQHLGNTGRTAKVAVYLERRMCIKKIGYYHPDVLPTGSNEGQLNVISL